MNIRALQLLRRIVLTGSLNEAAAAVNLSSSAASRLLSQFEAEIGLTLFSRSRRRLELTEEGQQFYAQITNTLVALDEIPKISRDIRRRTRDLFSVVTAAPLANGLAVPALARMRSAAVAHECTVNVASRFEIESKVAARGFTIGLISLPVENAIVALDVVPFLEARVGVLMPAEHPLAAQQEIAPAALLDEPLVSLTPGQRWRDRLDDVARGLNRPLPPLVETSSTLVTVEMVRAGLGVTLIDWICAPRAMDALTIRPLAGDLWSTYASLHPTGSRARLTETFLDAVSDHVEAERADDPLKAAMLRLI